MSNFLRTEGNSQPLTLWIDSTAYSARLLEGDDPPWLDVANFLAWQRKAQGLVRSDVVALPVESVVAAHLSANPGLRSAMAGKSRALYPLKVLLADEPVRSQLTEMLTGLRACFLGLPLVLTIPSPRAWISISYLQAHEAAACPEVGADEIDSASMYVADFLRAFSDADLAGLLLVERQGDEPQSGGELELYRPVLNVAKHYRWSTGVCLPEAQGAIAPVDGIDYFIAPRPQNAPTGVLTSEGFWTGGELSICPDGHFRFAEIPEGANPESVLDRLDTLRQSTVSVSEGSSV